MDIHYLYVYNNCTIKNRIIKLSNSFYCNIILFDNDMDIYLNESWRTKDFKYDWKVFISFFIFDTFLIKNLTFKSKCFKF
jgi:hypothetical protein